MSNLELNIGIVDPIEKCYLCHKDIHWGSCLTIHLCHVDGMYKLANIAHTDCVDLSTEECFRRHAPKIQSWT